MNHYERLKVSQDAPPEVIRAAYRALAAKLHPDRQQQQQGVATGPDDAVHGEMAALNAAYEVLIDPKLRGQYDATLLVPARGGGRMGMAEPVFGDAKASGASAEFSPGGNGSTRVDMDWMVPKPASSGALWPPSRRVAILGGGALGMVVLIAAGWFWQVAGQHKMERALSAQYASTRAAGDAGGDTPPAGVDAELLPPPRGVDKTPDRELAALGRDGDAGGETGATARRKPTVDELARMSDEELLRVLPTLDGSEAAAALAPPPPGSKTARRATVAAGVSKSAAHHPLDGKPLNLRTETQIQEDLTMDVSRLQQPSSGSAKPKKR